MLTAKSTVDKEKDALFNEIRHIMATQHGCPKHLTITDLKVIQAILTVKQYDNCE